ncbi:MAG: hypothetical protein WC803_08505 [Sphingomonas sp.]|jgi:hypothetical protein
MAKINEIEEAARDAKRVRDAADKADASRPKAKWPLVPIGIGIGIGSAALAAALLYATRNRKDDE